MSKPDINKILIREENYSAQMKEVVEPFLAERGEEFFSEREEGKKLHCMRYAADAPEAVLIISHGFTESIIKFREMIYYFLQANYEVYIFEHCGHAESYRLIDDPNKVHIDSYKRYIKDLLFIAHIARDANPELPLYLFGHSMGGGIAAAALATEPDLFSKAILTSPMIRSVRGGFPWTLTRFICWLFPKIGLGKRYAPTQSPYSGPEKFETSAASSKARFDHYQKIRYADPKLQMNGATYGWLHAATQMSVFIQNKGWKKITTPVLLFQAENETFVLNDQQEIFIQNLKSNGVNAELVHVKGTKHEICRSNDEVLEPYLEKIFAFFEG